MGFPTDVRYNRAWQDRGINRIWGADGSDLPDSSDVSVVSISGKAGVLLALELFSKSSDVYVKITVDGNRIDDDGAAEQAGNLYASYGCCGVGTLMRIQKYDMVSNQYVIELVQPIQFGNSLSIAMFAYGAGKKASCHAFYVANQ